MKITFTAGRRATVVLLCASMVLAACSAGSGSSGEDEVEYHISSLRPSAQVSADNEGGKGIFEIYSDNGIGSATVRLVSGEWPASIVLRFHLQGLESLQFAYNDATVHVSVNTQAVVLQSVSRNGAEEAIENGSRYWMPVSFMDRSGTAVERPVSGGTIEVVAPANFLSGDYAEFTINWIDFYR